MKTEAYFKNPYTQTIPPEWITMRDRNIPLAVIDKLTNIWITLPLAYPGSYAGNNNIKALY